MVDLPGNPNALVADTRHLSKLSGCEIARMFALFSSHYDGADPAIFQADLQRKTYVITLRNCANELCGFSTLAVDEHWHEGVAHRIFFSGDTIIDPAYWGASTLQTAWLRLVGRLLCGDQRPAYWLLTSKGHRTYRLLPLWFKTFFPHFAATDGQPQLKSLADSLGLARYGNMYDSKAGVIRKYGCGDRLAGPLAAIPAKDARRCDVRFFVDRNPHFGRGDELLCLAELSPGNMTRFSRRAFLKGNRDIDHDA